MGPQGAKFSPAGNACTSCAYIAYVIYKVAMEEPRSLDDATSVRIKQLDRNDDAALQVAHEKEQGLNHRSEVCRTAFPSRVQDACDPDDNSGHSRKAAA